MTKGQKLLAFQECFSRSVGTFKNGEWLNATMTELVACLSTGKGTWGHVNRLIDDIQWDKVILFTNAYGKENFTANAKTEVIVIDPEQGLKELRDVMFNELKAKVKSAEIAVNFISGTGREHMALMSAALRLGVGVRLFALTKEGAEEI